MQDGAAAKNGGLWNVLSSVFDGLGQKRDPAPKADDAIEDWVQAQTKKLTQSELGEADEMCSIRSALYPADK